MRAWEENILWLKWKRNSETKIRPLETPTRTHTQTHTQHERRKRKNISNAKKAQNKREKEREKKSSTWSRKEQRARTFGNLDHFFRFLWRMSVERKGRCFFKANALEKFWSQNALENFGLFFFLFLCCVPAPTHPQLLVLIWFAVMEKKKSKRRRREKNRRSVCSLFFKRNECMYVKRYQYPICFLNWTTTS